MPACSPTAFPSARCTPWAAVPAHPRGAGPFRVPRSHGPGGPGEDADDAAVLVLNLLTDQVPGGLT